MTDESIEQQQEQQAENDAETRAAKLNTMIAETHKNIDNMQKLCTEVRTVINSDAGEANKLQAIVFFNAIKNVCNAVTLLNNQLVPSIKK